MPVPASIDHKEREATTTQAQQTRKKAFRESQTPTAVQVKVEPPVRVQLSETSTDMLFVMRGLVVASESREFQVVEQKNDRYEVLCAQHSNTDKFKIGRAHV